MSIIWNKPCVAATTIRQQKDGLAKTFLSRDNDLRRINGLPLAFITMGYELSIKISYIVEPLFKGLGNIFGSMWKDDCSFLRGLGYLALSPALGVVACLSLPIFVVATAVQLVTYPIWALLHPKSLLNFLESESPIEKLMRTQLGLAKAI